MSWAWAAILDGGKSMGETLGRRENMASPGTRGKLVGVVLSEAEYINTFNFLLAMYGVEWKAVKRNFAYYVYVCEH